MIPTPLFRPARAGLAAVLLAAAAACGQTADLSVGGLNVHATAVADNIFKISVGDVAAAKPTVFIDPAFKPDAAAGKTTTDGTKQTIRTAAGQLQLDTAAGTYTLLNANGDVLIPTAPVATAGSGEHPKLALHVGWPKDKAFGVYGCGNQGNGLVQNAVQSGVGNGRAVVPYFWSPAGYATFVVGANDDRPASCDGRVENDAVAWVVPGASADLYLIVAPTLADGTRGLLTLNGRPPVPPKWAFGYLQSRWGWKDKAYIDDALKQFQNRKIPVDAFILDFEWYTTFPDYGVKPEGEPGFVDFGWNPALFPHPAEQIKQLHDAGVKFVAIRKPRLGNSETLKEIRAKGWDFAHTPKEQQSVDRIDSRGLLFIKPEVRAWYAEQIEPLLKDGIDGWWDDEGEFTYTNYYYWTLAQRQALDAIDPKQRLWTINRAFQPGTSRLGATAWTGDIDATWGDFAATPATLENWGLAGQPFGSCDIGGHRSPTTPQLLTRWMEAGTFFPNMRTHSTVTVPPHFPWLFGDAAEAAMKKAIELRMRLVPMLYSLAHRTHETGTPIIQPLLTAYPSDPKCIDLSSEWLVGDGLLAAPVLREDGQDNVYLPEGTWYDLATGEATVGPKDLALTPKMDECPAYVRAGTILPLGPVVQHTRDLPGGPLELRIYPGRDATFTLAEDDGMTSAYLTGGVRKTTFNWNDATRELSWTRNGSYDGADCFKDLHVVVVGGNAAPVDQPLTPSGHVVMAK